MAKTWCAASKVAPHFHLPKHEPYCLPEARSFGQRPRKLHCWSSVDRHQTQMLVIVERKTVADHFPIETSITFGFVLMLSDSFCHASVDPVVTVRVLTESIYVRMH